MSNNPKDIALEYLERNGYPFEMKVAHKFQAAGFGIHQSIYFADPYTDNVREIDLLAMSNFNKGGVNFNIFFILECKYAATPWIIFSSITKGFPQCYVHNQNGKMWLDHLVTQPFFEEFFECERNLGYGMVTSEGKPKPQQGNQENGKNEHKVEKVKNNAFAAIQGVLNFLKSSDGAARFGAGSDHNIFVPIIAIKGKLIEAKLDRNEEVICREINEAQIHIKENIMGVIPKIHVITEEKLDTFIAKLKNDCRRIFEPPYYLDR
ncbi:hypothetical protein [Paraflavitalea sp. CAU 1676]|uniref:hypothetical protein n=1 Tax=Paraflavitalea sp. CAU 1676 TaxID=3032598 RepID=UPI0023DB21D7|nr:hypothetical protein [Paraflavitalea sp. CAU 1676]MDF2188298.1 hypothetical protein [Paraflavitalea sp. CAU 1676]